MVARLMEAVMTNVAIAKIHNLEVNVDKFNAEVRDYIFAYGLKQILNDAGSAGKSADEKLAMAEKKLAAMYDGTVRAVRAAKPGMSPRDSLIYKYARADVAAVLKAAGRKIGDEPAEKIEAAIAKITEKNAATYGKRADAELAAKSSTAGLADLGL